MHTQNSYKDRLCKAQAQTLAGLKTWRMKQKNLLEWCQHAESNRTLES